MRSESHVKPEYVFIVGRFRSGRGLVGVMRDRLSQPRYRATILYHLIYHAEADTRDALPGVQPSRVAVVSSRTMRIVAEYSLWVRWLASCLIWSSDSACQRTPFLSTGTPITA
jgi:hypothetical protein